jgi:hypothetical protein
MLDWMVSPLKELGRELVNLAERDVNFREQRRGHSAARSPGPRPPLSGCVGGAEQSKASFKSETAPVAQPLERR